MIITLTPDLEIALNAAADSCGVAPEALAVTALSERFLGEPSPLQPRDEWERRLLSLSRDCGVSLPNSAVRREALYE